VTSKEGFAKCIAMRGYIVIGLYPTEPGCSPLNIGATTLLWGGWLLQNEVQLISKTSRKDWDRQFQLLFPGQKDCNEHERGSRFFRAVPV
jgi:hypothetical protein